MQYSTSGKNSRVNSGKRSLENVMHKYSGILCCVYFVGQPRVQPFTLLLGEIKVCSSIYIIHQIIFLTVPA